MERKRTIHLDFQTSPDIKNIGKNFSKEKFQQAVKVANAQSITVFAKCHHGYSYYPTKIGTMHPGLNFDLLGAMIDAAHEIGVEAPIYIPVGWSDLDAMKHPEWITMHGDEPSTMNYDIHAKEDDAKPHASWLNMCLNDNGFAKYNYEIIHELCKNYTIDGLFIDICWVGQYCQCEECKKGMQLMGMNPENIDDCIKYFEEKRLVFTEKCAEILHSYYPDATIFFNSGGADMKNLHRIKYETHIEMEDLPTAWGGYDKMPLRAKVFKQTGLDYFGMTAKFHLDWGEFGGFKTKEALKYEIASMCLYGAGCSVGDHLHPEGEMDMETYKNIGYAFDYHKQIEDYVYNGKTQTPLGVYLSKDNSEIHGVIKILLENQIEFDVVINDDFSSYSTLIFPSGCVLKDASIKKVQEFIDNGGKVLFMGDSLIKDNKFLIDCGGEVVGDNQFDCNYLHVKNAKRDIPDSPILYRITSKLIKATDGLVLGEITQPYFSRTYKHFCGHKNTPDNKGGEVFAGVIKKNNVVYIANPIGANYNEYGAVVHKRMFMEVLDQIYQSDVKIDLYSQGRISFTKQQQNNRYCLGLLYASPVKRGCAEIIEDIVPIYNIPVTVCVKEKIKKVYSPVTEKEYDFTQNNNEIMFTVDKLLCHDIIVMEY